MKFSKKIIAITPMVCLIAYLLMGFLIGGVAWAWGLCVFVLCPIMPYLVKEKKLTLSVSFVITLIYVVGCLIGEAFGLHLWHPGWLIFLFIPIIHILLIPSTPEKIVKKYSKNFEDRMEDFEDRMEELGEEIEGIFDDDADEVEVVDEK